MTVLVQGDNRGDIQCFAIPPSGSTTSLAVSAVSATVVLPKAVYRFECPVDCQVAGGALALVTDMSLKAGVPEYFEVAGNVSAIAAAASTLKMTRV